MQFGCEELWLHFAVNQSLYQVAHVGGHRGWLLAVTAPATALGSLALHTAASVLPWHCAAAGAAVVPAVMAVRWVQEASSSLSILSS